MKALVCVDLQNDFILKSGALFVKGAEKIIPIINRLIVEENFNIIVLTQDWHPASHKSFALNNKDAKIGEVGELNGKPQVWWPDHCVWGTTGAQFHKNLLPGRADLILRKGTNKEVDSYSAFFDNDGSSVGLGGYLKDRGVDQVYVCGVATDYCVKYTVLDSIKIGFNTILIENGCRAVNINKGDGDKAVKEMEEAGATRINMQEIKGGKTK